MSCMMKTSQIYGPPWFVEKVAMQDTLGHMSRWLLKTDVSGFGVVAQAVG